MKDLLAVKNGQAVVSSRQVAEHFGKEHKNVMVSIREILAAEKSATKMFYETTYQNRGKQYPEYLMNRDGFSLLAMGFTGKEAVQWKIKYINAFNEMETRLKGNPSAIQSQRAEAMLLNAKTRQSKAWLTIADKTDIPEYKHICQQKAAEALAGSPILPLESVKEKTFSATEVGKMYGVDKRTVGRIAKRNNLKTDQYGKWFYDKSPHSDKQVETFRYNQEGVAAIGRILDTAEITAAALHTEEEFNEKYCGGAEK